MPNVRRPGRKFIYLQPADRRGMSDAVFLYFAHTRLEQGAYSCNAIPQLQWRRV